MTTTHMKQNDRLPDYTATLQTGSGSGAAPIDLTDCTVRFLMVAAVGNTPKVAALATIDTAAEGTVRHQWAATDLDTPGEYSVEWEITYPSGKTLTVPSAGYDTIVVVNDVN